MNDEKGFLLSAFTDEYSPSFDAQIEGLRRNGIKYMEIRGVDGRNIDTLSLDETRECKRKLDENGIGLSAVGSPIGKIGINDDFDKHTELLRHVCEQAHILGTRRVRMFSFYMPKDDGTRAENIAKYRGKVTDRLGRMLDIAEKEDIFLCNENELGLYCEGPNECLEMQRVFGTRLGCVFDHANFILGGHEAYPYAFSLLRDRLTYMHIKDADASRNILPAGEGIGHMTESLSAISRKEGFFLTLEPHQRAFTGLAKLNAGSDAVVRNRFETSEEAFGYAVTALRKCISEI